MDHDQSPGDDSAPEFEDADAEATTYDVMPDARGHAMLRPIILTRTDQQAYDEMNARRIMVPELVDNPRYPKASVHITIQHQRRHTPKEIWHNADHFDLRHLRQGEEVRLKLDAGETRRLYDELCRLYTLPASDWDGKETRQFVVVPADDVLVTDESQRDRVAALLKTLDAEDWEMIEELRPGLLDTIALKRQHEARLDDLAAFEGHLESGDWGEGEWQKFFENHKWIFGHNLIYQFVTPIAEQPRIAAQDYEGHDGQRGDFLMATEARARFTVLVDIKKPTTDLLGKKTYRNQVYPPGSELVGGVAQLQSNCHNWLIDGAQQPRNVKRLASQRIHTYEPRGILIVGHTRELESDDDKAASFELLRRNTRNPEIITYDELLERARFMLAMVW